jgi:hypothetical protein
MGKKNRASILFTNIELEIIKIRLNGNLNDSTGVFSRRIRPKLKEILAWNTPSMKRQLKKLLKQKRTTDTELQESPPQKSEMGFEEFKKKHGY